MGTALEARYDTMPESLPVTRRAFRRAIADFDLTPQLAADITLAVTEAVANAIRQAYPDGIGVFGLTVSRTDEIVTITVSDAGVGIATQSATPARDSASN
jgi:anti-sigma regulatory factor (Ser/Thr protein kinase)